MSSRLSIPILLIVILLLSAVFQSATFIGFEGWADDAYYLQAAAEWRDEGATVGEDHWSLRHTYVLPLAVMLTWFPGSEFAIAVPSLIAFFGIVTITFLALHPQVGPASAFSAAMMVAITPLFAVTADQVMVWQVELVLILASFWLLWYSRDSRHFLWLSLAAGAFAALAFLTRASAAAYLVGLGLLFLFGYGPPKRNFLIAALAFLVIIFVDMVYFKIMADDWMYRLKVITNHGDFAGQLATRTKVNPDALNVSSQSLIFKGNPGERYSEHALVKVSGYVDPYLMLFIHYYLGLLFWVALAAVIKLRSISVSLFRGTRSHGLLGALIILASSWYLVGLYIISLRPHPRYWGLTTYVAAILAGLFIVWLWQQRRRVWAAGISACLIVGHLLLVQMNASSEVATRWLADYVQDTGYRVHVSEPYLRRMNPSTYLFVVRGVGDLVQPLPDPDAKRIWVDFKYALPTEIADHPEEWLKTWERRSRVTWLGEILGWVGLLEKIPGVHRDRLVVPDANVALFERRSPAAASPAGQQKRRPVPTLDAG